VISLLRAATRSAAATCPGTLRDDGAVAGEQRPCARSPCRAARRGALRITDAARAPARATARSLASPPSCLEFVLQNLARATLARREREA